MANFAVLNGNLVVNIIDAPNLQIAEEATKCQCIEFDIIKSVGIGMIWDGSNFIDPSIAIEITPPAE